MVCEPTRVTEHCASILDLFFVSQSIVADLSQLIGNEGIWSNKILSLSMTFQAGPTQGEEEIECRYLFGADDLTVVDR